jgi:hypothetical protein
MMVDIMEELPTMESILRALREMAAEKQEHEPDAAPQSLPEEIERAIRE